MLEPENYVNGGTGLLKFVAQPHKVNLGVQPFKSFVDTERGHEVQVRGRNQPEKQNPVNKQNLLREAPVILPIPVKGRAVGSRCNAEEFYIGKTNWVGYNKRSPLHFKSVWFEHGYGNKRELGSSDWAGKSLTVEVNGEGKRRVAWKKGGLRNSLWVTRDQKEHVPSSSRVHQSSLVGLGNQMGLPVFSGPKPTGPMRLEVGESPTLGDPRLLRQEAQASVMSKVHHEASEAQDNTNAYVVQVVESSAPPVKAGTVRHQDGLSSGTMRHQDGSPASQNDMDRCSVKVSTMVGGPFSDGFHAGLH